MDLLREHYGSDSDGGSSDDRSNEEIRCVEQTAQDVSAAASAVAIGGGKSGNGRRGKKRPLPPSTIETSRTSAQQQQQQGKFVRAVPHTPGNWAGHIFFPLAPTPSSSAGSSSVYDATNQAASRRLHIAANELIENFATTLKERCRWQNDKESGRNKRLSNMEVVSHVAALPVELDESSSSDDENDKSSSDESIGVELGRSGRQSREAGQVAKTETLATTKTTEANGSNVPLHISLSRPFYLQQQSISSFVEHVRSVLVPHSPMPVTFDVNNPEVLVNDERTRSFLTIPTAQNSLGSPIVRMIHSIDPVMKRFGHSPYYEEAKVHTSIASVSGDVRSLLVGTSYCEGKHDGTADVAKATQNITFMVDRVMLTFGTTNEHCILLTSSN